MLGSAGSLLGAASYLVPWISPVNDEANSRTGNGRTLSILTARGGGLNGDLAYSLKGSRRVMSVLRSWIPPGEATRLSTLVRRSTSEDVALEQVLHATKCEDLAIVRR